MVQRLHDAFLDEIVPAIVERVHPERVILFGSRARGDHQADSDYDLIVVADDSIAPSDREREIRDLIYRPDHPTDVILFTRSEFERKRADVGTLAYVGITEGVTLYECAPLPPQRVREDPNEPPDSLAEWVRRAESDFRSTNHLSEVDSVPDGICFHAHQSAEKFLEAALVRRHVPPPRTHVLRALLERSEQSLRDAAGIQTACALLDDLFPKSRYPREPMPTPDEARAAIAAAQLVRDRILPLLR